MGNKVVVHKNGIEEVFEDVLGHQVGYSHIQVLLRNGSQRIISSFDEIDITLDDEGIKKFVEDLENMENTPEKAANDANTALASVTDLPVKS